MGPPTQLPRSCNKSLLGKKYQDAVEADEATRKKVSLQILQGMSMTWLFFGYKFPNIQKICLYI